MSVFNFPLLFPSGLRCFLCPFLGVEKLLALKFLEFLEVSIVNCFLSPSLFRFNGSSSEELSLSPHGLAGAEGRVLWPCGSGALELLSHGHRRIIFSSPTELSLGPCLDLFSTEGFSLFLSTWYSSVDQMIP